MLECRFFSACLFSFFVNNKNLGHFFFMFVSTFFGRSSTFFGRLSSLHVFYQSFFHVSIVSLGFLPHLRVVADGNGNGH